MQQFLLDYSKIEDIGLNRVLFIDTLALRPSVLENSFVKNQLEKTSMARVVAIPVTHIYNSYAFLVEDKQGTKVAFSGDCRPSDDFAEIAQNADLLIHESTFEDEKQSEAECKKHSTMSEAIGVAKA
jgi:ribonuclease Z